MSDQRTWQVVLARIEADLAAGILRPGDHLAPERTLAADLGVGRSSVREAVRVLEVLGIIRTQTGSGPSSGAVITAAPSDGMSVLMRLQVAAQGFPVDDVVRTRLLLETAVVGELAQSAEPDLTERAGAARGDGRRSRCRRRSSSPSTRSSTWRWPPPPATRW